MTPTLAEAARRRIQGRRNKAIGTAAEDAVRLRLIHIGLGQVCRIHMGYHVTRGPGGKILRVSPMERVPGDWRAVGPAGVSVLVETKWRPDRLVWSDLERHQVEALEQHHRLGGLSLVAWVHRAGIHVLRWNRLVDHGFRARTSLTPEQAAGLEWSP